MTESTTGGNTATAEGSAVSLDNPLPESSFVWRRALTWLIAILCLALVWQVIEHLHDLRDVDGLVEANRYLIVFAGLVVTYYMLGVSAQELTQLIQSARLFAGGLVIRKTATADAETGRTTTTVAAGPAAPAPETGPTAPIAPSPVPDAPEIASAADGPSTADLAPLPERTPWDADQIDPTDR